MKMNRKVISRHRLPQPYRTGLAAFWLAPLILMTSAALIGGGQARAMLDPRFLLLALLMTVPAIYVWQEGVDVREDGIVRRVHVPRYYPYESLAVWAFDSHPSRRLLTIWDARRRKVLECRAGHLTDLPLLLDALRARVRGGDASRGG
jgi:hypothetical protein